MSTSRPSILVCDSGVGGLSICLPLLAARPDVHLSYLADFEGFPYGTRSEQSLRDRVLSLVRPLMARVKPDVLVIACNTASTLLLPDLRAILNIPVVGVVPAIKPAALLSKTKRIGLLATPATVSRPYIDQLVSDFANDCEVVKVGSSRLVEVAEDWLFGRPWTLADIEESLIDFHQINDQPVDLIVLGCTHFPLIKHFLDDAWHQNSSVQVSWLDSGEAIARRVATLLPDAVAHPKIRHHQFIYTGYPIPKQDITQALGRIGMDGFSVTDFSSAS